MEKDGTNDDSKLKPIDVDDAPEGCAATPLESRYGFCHGCCFDADRGVDAGTECHTHPERRCTPEERKDDHMVIFKKKEGTPT